MLSKAQLRFQTFLWLSALFTTLIPFNTAKSQTTETGQYQVATKSIQAKTIKNNPAKLSPDNLLAETVKPSVVRVVLGCEAKVYLPKNGKVYKLSQIISHGSGFFVHRSGTIASNAHVTQFSAEECQYILKSELSDQLKDDGKNLEDVEKDLKWIENKPINLVYLPNGEQLPFKIIISGDPVGEGKDVSIIQVNLKNAPALKLADSEQVKLMDQVIAVGYPGVVERLPVDWKENSFQEATFTKGIVSAKKTLDPDIPVIQISAAAAPGNSGGPVLNEQGEVIGMVTFGVPDSNNYIFLFTSNTIQEFLQKAGIINEQSLVNRQYQEGLQFYNQGNYSQALQRFKLVKSLFPQHSEVEKFLKNCQEIIASKI
ncbi:trypsin-like peptidase domain-containing protein [Calothrix sp. FACHB-1219]|uniref:S1C family serine protease n=1 Tax=unclassified Calothrix TaxID=2619626 RepID=UPI001684C978|nr:MULTISPECIES: serine protease [unclassified Calothrix]MBD2201396.1 trypsin-like peptidase domain-containing protein [Calothrix sp. FACHB-168]MBD2215828.1 trypsin-like peptidase domain-containing protein [Calothrix sp. FACHB-1219]